MPPLGGKGKSKGREGRQSRSRNTTPSSIVSLSASIGPSTTAYLDIPIGHLMVPTNINYDDILERHGGGGGIPDPKHLETMANDLKTLSQLAETRGQACDGGMRELAKRRKEKVEEEREREQATREAGEKESIKRAAEDDDDTKGRKKNKVKKPVRERITAAEERPLTHGAHGLARQDGLDLPIKGMNPSFHIMIPIRICHSLDTLIHILHTVAFKSSFPVRAPRCCLAFSLSPVQASFDDSYNDTFRI